MAIYISSLQDLREQVAREEVGRTKISRGLAWVLVAQFLLVIGAVPLGEILDDRFNPRAADALGARLSRLARAVLPPARTEPARPLFSRIVSHNRALIAELKRFEDDAEDQSRLGRQLRPPTQYLLASLGAGNEQVYLGHTPWLFYRQSVDYLSGAGFLEPAELDRRRRASTGSGGSLQPDPRPAIRQLQEALGRRGIELVVMPAPVKPTVHPENFGSGFAGREDPLRPASFGKLIEELKRSGVLVFDPAPALLDAKSRTGAPQYLTTDTHWRPEALERVAVGLRDFVIEHVDLPPAPRAGYVSESLEVTNQGDLARLVVVPEWQTRYPAERVRLRQIRTANGAPWQPSRSGDVLLLGDSFSNIYSLAAMGWGESAGLAAQLSFLLQRPVDAIVQNADGAFATRGLVARELASGRDRLAGKRLVIFQFAERELAFGDWKLLDFDVGGAAPDRFFVPEAEEEVVVSGTVREIAPVPHPGTVPYADHITALHLVDLASERPGVSGAEAVVYVWGMRDHVLQEAARIQVGDRITVRLRPWSDVAERYDGISRSELANEDAQLQEPGWGEVLP